MRTARGAVRSLDALFFSNGQPCLLLKNKLSLLSVSFGKDRGHLLENILYWKLRRKGWNLYYWNEHNCECDFVACRENIPQKLIQVCYELNGDNESREVNGLIDAMDSLKLEDAVIVTLDQKDIIRQQDSRINIVPVYEFLKVL